MNSAKGIEESTSLVNSSTSAPRKQHEDEDENGYVRMDECLSVFSQNSAILPSKLQKSDEGTTKDRFQAKNTPVMRFTKHGKGCLPVVPQLHYFATLNQSNFTSLTNGTQLPVTNAGGPSNHRIPSLGNVIQGNVSYDMEHENRVYDGVDIDATENDPVYANVLEIHVYDDTVNETSENSARTNETVVDAKNACDGGNPVPTLDYPSNEIAGEVYDDVIHTPPGNTASRNESVEGMAKVKFCDEVQFVLTQDNPAYTTTPGIHDDSNHVTPEKPPYPNRLVVNEDSSQNGLNSIMTSKEPTYASAQEIHDNVICVQPKIPAFKSASLVGEDGTRNGRSIATKHNMAYAIRQNGII